MKRRMKRSDSLSLSLTLRETMMYENDIIWIVDYDIPSSSTVRSRFYRCIHRHARARGILNMRSTRSVIITRDEMFARFVYEKAIELGGKAHLYLAKRIR